MGSIVLPSEGPVYVDAQVLIYSVEKHPVYASLLRPLWSAVQAGQLDVVSSELVVLEALVVPYRNQDTALIAVFDRFFIQPGFRLEPITQAIHRSAAQLRAITRLRTPDAIHAATAMQTACTEFFTNDKSFRSVAGLRTQTLDDLLTP